MAMYYYYVPMNKSLLFVLVWSHDRSFKAKIVSQLFEFFHRGYFQLAPSSIPLCSCIFFTASASHELLTVFT